MAKIIDVRGNGRPLVGRLRGVTARHEIRPTLDLDGEKIYFEAKDAHFKFREKVPSPLPDALTNTERQLVVSRRLADVLVALEPTIEIVPVRLVDAKGKPVKGDYVVAAPKGVVNCIEHGDGEMIGGYIHGVIKGAKAPKQTPPLFRVGYTFVIGCSDAAAAKLSKFTGLELVSFPDYVEELLPFPPAPYELLRCGTEGAELRFPDKNNPENDLEQGTSLVKTWPKTATAKMSGPKSRKKIVDFTTANGAPLITEKTRGVLEKFGLSGVELLPTQVKDHAGKAVAGHHWLLHVTATQPYVDVEESDIDVKNDKLWTVREIVVDETHLTERPPFFRIPGARFAWVFVRRDVLDAMIDAKLTGFRTEHPAKHSHTVEGGDLPRVC